MNQKPTPHISLSTGTDLAFALVVFVHFFTAFSSQTISSLFVIIVIIFLGIAYITNGIYGFLLARKSQKIYLKLGYFLLQFLIGGLIVYYGKGAGLNALILLPVVAHIVMLLDPDWALVANFGLLITYLVSVWAYSHSAEQLWSGFAMFFVGMVFIFIFTQMAVTEQKAREKVEDLAVDLSEANKHLSEYADQVHSLTITQERNRFAREIHDGLGHSLTTLNMQLKAAAALVRERPEKAEEMIKNAQILSSEALTDVRSSVYELRKDPFDLGELTDRIQKLISNSNFAGTKVKFSVIGTPREISPPVDLTIFRAAQETLNNAQKHSRATQIGLILDFSNANLVIFRAQDNGVGVESIQEGFGLIGIQERLQLLNGDYTIKTEPGKGLIFTMRIPS